MNWLCMECVSEFALTMGAIANIPCDLIKQLNLYSNKYASMTQKGRRKKKGARRKSLDFEKPKQTTTNNRAAMTYDEMNV